MALHVKNKAERVGDLSTKIVSLSFEKHVRVFHRATARASFEIMRMEIFGCTKII